MKVVTFFNWVPFSIEVSSVTYRERSNVKLTKHHIYQFCFPKLRNIEHCAKDKSRQDIASHPPANASAHGAVAVLVRAAHTAESGYKAAKTGVLASEYLS